MPDLRSAQLPAFSVSMVALVSQYQLNERAVKNTILFIGLLLLYGLLFMILSAENLALLLGSALLFVVLAGVMLLTRRVNWYGVTGSFEAANVRGVVHQGSVRETARGRDRSSKHNDDNKDKENKEGIGGH